ncbi:hypothetical protein WH50_06550 [Pokkaliibacter plantistimulans]|uniref:EAL domain-containing protein n=1 Tax=Pokkaliibacter plantistimulans TaxID=1635171 RepID=A0ABX5LZA7_9GAMM|nr:EAL domain-containing protein [Pokkaliibacter plantistimulans]PXF31987.1 hypothetical protein WH50_06550 [Pokkaliibacter plantistimulans]
MSLHRDCLHIVIRRPLDDAFMTVLANIRQRAEHMGLFIREEGFVLEPACGEFDIVLLVSEHIDEEASDWLRHQRRHLQDQPLVVLSTGRAPDVLADCCLRLEDCLPPRDEFCLALLDDLLHSWRQQMRLRRHLNSEVSQLHSLLDIQTDPVALVRYPHHTYANLAYRRLWQIQDELHLEDMDMAEVFSPIALTALHQRLPTWRPGETLNLQLSEEQQLGNLQFQLQCLAPSPENVFLVRMISDVHQNNLDEQADDILNRASYDRRSLLDQIHYIQYRGEHQGNDVQWALMAIRLENWLLLDELGEPTAETEEQIHLLEREIPEASTLHFGCMDQHHLCVLAPFDKQSALLGSGQLLLEQIGSLLPLTGASMSNSFCAGLVQIHGTLPDAETLLHQAIHACAQAQRQGQSLFVYTSQRSAPGGQRAASQVRQQLRKAMDHNHFTLFYQPILNLFSPGDASYEVLLRMSDDQGQWITPVDLLSQAEQTGQALLIDQWVTERLCLQLKKQQLPLRVFINISAQAIHDPAFFVWLEATMKEVPPQHELVMQISEVDVWAAGRQAALFCEQLHQLGLKLCLKHLGMTTHAEQLSEQFDCDYYKLHGPLIRTVNQPDTQARIARLIAPLVPKGKTIIGPMVENASCLSLLWQAGIKYIQGHYLQPPHQHMDYVFTSDD